MTENDLAVFKQIGAFAANVPNLTNRAVVDAAGSSIDTIYAEGVLKGMPTLVVEEYGLMETREWGGPEDSVTFPIWKNFDLTWTDISGTGSDTGSDVAATQGPDTTWRKITPVMYSARIFIHDMVGISVNKHNFEYWSTIGGIAVQRKIDQDAITNGIMACEDNWSTGSNLYVATGVNGSALTTGSISTASTLNPRNLMYAKMLLSTGSDPMPSDCILMYPNQYYQLITHKDFSETSESDMRRYAKWENGTLVGFDNMQLVVTELIKDGTAQPSAFKGYYTASAANIGRPLAVFSKKKTGALAKKTQAFAVHSVDDRLKHGVNKVFDIMFKAEPLIPESAVIIRCSD